LEKDKNHRHHHHHHHPTIPTTGVPTEISGGKKKTYMIISQIDTVYMWRQKCLNFEFKNWLQKNETPKTSTHNI
jgi:hypothetical protein